MQNAAMFYWLMPIALLMSAGYFYKKNFAEFEKEKAEIRKTIEQQSEELKSQSDKIIQKNEELASMLDVVSRQKKFSEMLNRFNTEISLSPNLYEVCGAILNNCLDIFGCQAGMLIVIHPKNKVKKIIACSGLSINLDESEFGEEKKLGGLIERCIEEKKMILASYPQSALTTDVYVNVCCKMIHEVYFPFITYDNTVGAMVLGRINNNNFNQEEIDLIKKLSQQGALAIYNSFTYLEMEETYGQLYEQGILVNELNEQLRHERDNIKRERNIAQLVINSINEGICMIDLQSSLVLVNKQWEEYFCCSQGCEHSAFYAKVFGKSLATLHDSAEIKDALKYISAANDVQATFEIDIRDHVLKIWTGPVTDGTGVVNGRLFVYHDITKEAEVDRMKSELVATVSHELRTPLTSILGFSELLTSKQFSEEKKQLYIKTIHKESYRLTQLINDFLDLQKMESGGQVYSFDDEDAKEIIQEAVKLFSDKSAKHQIFVDVPPDNVYVRADNQRVVQVLVNLIANAIKFSPGRDSVKVGVVVEKGMACFSVADQGLGIPENVVPQLFKKFYRVDNSDRRKIGGTGLGLAICKEIVLAHKGQIWVHSDYEVGSTFYFTVPLVENRLQYENISEAFNESTANLAELVKIDFEETKKNLPLVLIVEDDVSLTVLFKEELERNGYNVITTESGENTLHTVKKVIPHAIILDIRLAGELDGWTVLQHLKQNAITAKIPIIISSCLSEREIGLAMGASEYLVKPFEPGMLVSILKKFVSGSNPCMVVPGETKVNDWLIPALSKRGMEITEVHKEKDLVYLIVEKRDKT